MKNATPRQLALAVSLLLSTIVTSLFVLLSYIAYGSVDTWLIGIMFPVIWCVSFLLYQFALDKFIYRKIKLVYKTIHQLKVKTHTDDLKKRIRAGNDIISEVNEEVLEWAKDKKNEIDQLKKLEEYRRDFIGNLSHELKTPIFNIQGYITTLIDGGATEKEILEKYLQNTEKNVERMISLVEDLDTIYKLETSRVHLEMEKFDIVETSRDVVDMIEMKARQRGISIQWKDDYRLPIYVFADRSTIKQVLTNLIVNSIVYGQEGGTTKLSFYDMDENILCEVADDGPGIEEKHLSRLFERFYRVDKSRSRHQGGTGLGLSIVKHIMEAHQQTINVRSTVGRGSTFSFTLKKYRAGMK